MDQMNDFIEKLIKSTDKSNIKWKPILTLKNVKLDEYLHNINIGSMNSVTISTNELEIDFDKSYYTDYRGGYIYLFCKKSKKPVASISTIVLNNVFYRYFVLAIQKDPVIKIVEQPSSKEYQADLIRLSELIERQLLNADDFISGFLNDPDI